MSAAVKFPVKERSPDCGGCSCGSVVVAALPTPTGTRNTMTGPEVVALPCRGGGRSHFGSRGQWQHCWHPPAVPHHSCLPTSWMCAIVHASAFSTSRFQNMRLPARVAFQVPLVAVLMTGICAQKTGWEQIVNPRA